ncbi:phospholipase A2-like, partial [Clarias magur]
CAACGQTVSCAQWQFDKMITCRQPKVNPIIYNKYGCNCVFYGAYIPKDQIDQCCVMHLKCYQYVRDVQECSDDKSVPYNKEYNYVCSAKTIICP